MTNQEKETLFLDKSPIFWVPFRSLNKKNLRLKRQEKNHFSTLKNQESCPTDGVHLN